MRVTTANYKSEDSARVSGLLSAKFFLMILKTELLAYHFPCRLVNIILKYTPFLFSFLIGTLVTLVRLLYDLRDSAHFSFRICVLLNASNLSISKSNQLHVVRTFSMSKASSPCLYHYQKSPKIFSSIWKNLEILGFKMNFRLKLLKCVLPIKSTISSFFNSYLQVNVGCKTTYFSCCLALSHFPILLNLTPYSLLYKLHWEFPIRVPFLIQLQFNSIKNLDSIIINYKFKKFRIFHREIIKF